MIIALTAWGDHWAAPGGAAGPLRSPGLRRPDPPAAGLPGLRHRAPTGAGGDAAGPRRAGCLVSRPPSVRSVLVPRRAHPTGRLVPGAPAVLAAACRPSQVRSFLGPINPLTLPNCLRPHSSQRHRPIPPVLDVDEWPRQIAFAITFGDRRGRARRRPGGPPHEVSLVCGVTRWRAIVS